MSNTVNVTDAIATFSATITEQRNGLVAELEQLDNQRASLVQQMGVIDRTLAALSGRVLPAERPAGSGGPGTRKPMSEQGKANIKAALDARRARLAAEAAGKAAETLVVPETAPEAASEPVQEAAQEPVAVAEPVVEPVADAALPAVKTAAKKGAKSNG